MAVWSGGGLVYRFRDVGQGRIGYIDLEARRGRVAKWQTRNAADARRCGMRDFAKCRDEIDFDSHAQSCLAVVAVDPGHWSACFIDGMECSLGRADRW